MPETHTHTYTQMTPTPLIAISVCVYMFVCALDIDGLQMQTNDRPMTIPVIVSLNPHTPPPFGNTSRREGVCACVCVCDIHQGRVERGRVPSVTFV